MAPTLRNRVNLILLAGVALATAAVADTPPSVAEKTGTLERRDGLFRLWLDGSAGQVYLELPAPDAEGVVARVLYVEGIQTGLGSNPVGLDRGQVGGAQLLAIRRVADRVLFEIENLAFRATSDDPDERRAARESFATSVIWASALAALDPDGRSLIDLTPFALRDAHDVAGRLRGAGQGSFALDSQRSVLLAADCLAFPDNLELSALLTFGASDPGGEVAATAPQPSAVTLMQHQSLVRLPPDGYTPRRFDPRASSFEFSFRDYSAPLDQPLLTRWIIRHRLEKVDPSAERSNVKEPIVYYVDRGAPEPVRSALIEGTRWWAAAFEAAGFVDAFRVELLPADANPLDTRYNVVEWVHRATRGWAYGNAIVDPRTGEIIKGHVTLDSLRIRYDRVIAEGLLGADSSGSGGANDPVQIALARIRQLAAHEVGHTLGFAHNYAASTYADRASVMDYPAPRVLIDPDGKLDFSQAYGVGVGAWDDFAVRYAYSQFAPQVDTDAALDALLRDATAGGLLFLTDDDARPLGGAHPLANLWDDGPDPVEQLAHVLRVRRIALTNFGERNVRDGAPLATLEEVLSTVYFYHRYQVEAAAKSVGGVDYRFSVRGEGLPGPAPVENARQRRALELLLTCLEPETLTLPENVLSVLPPRPFGYPRVDESFRHGTSPAFDPLSAAATAADLVIQALLEPARCARLVDQNLRDASLLSFEEALSQAQRAVFPWTASGRRTTGNARSGSAGDEELMRVVQNAWVARLIGLAANESAPAYVRERADGMLESLRGRLSSSSGSDATERDHRRGLAATITRYLARPLEGVGVPQAAWPPPAGSPLGSPVDRSGCSTDAP